MKKREYKVLRLGDILKDGESISKEYIAKFSCPLNNDVEHFLKSVAIDNQRKNISRTSLVYATIGDSSVLVGYYSIAIKTLTLKDNFPSSLRKKLTGFSHDTLNSTPIFLIGQLSKNFQNGYNKHIKGRDLLSMVFKDIKDTQKLIGGRAMLVECKDDIKLKRFYEGLGFTLIEGDSTDRLLQYVCKISKFKID